MIGAEVVDKNKISFLREAKGWGGHSCWYDIPVHITCEGEGEVFEEDGIVEIPAVRNGIDDGVGGGVGFEEAGTAIDTDGFGGGIFWKSYTACAWSHTNAFNVGEF